MRASKGGHRYHEAWTARRALELIFPRDGLKAIAIEGLHAEDEEGLSKAAVEIADTTFYFEGDNFETASKLRVEQFKFSLSRASIPLRASDAGKTLSKFAQMDADFTGKHGEKARTKIRYCLTTNRPISSDFAAAIATAATMRQAESPTVEKQLKQVEKATGLTGAKLASFTKRLELVGHGDNLTQAEGLTQRTIADWSASEDVHVRARLGGLRKLIQDKAGPEGQRNKLITREDVLASLGVGDERALLPTPQAFPSVGEVVEREQLDDLQTKLKTKKILLVHAAGGVGKTVFVQSLAKRCADRNEVVLFDCFGGGAYRSQADGRHRAERGLMHIINELAIKGLCDPILPGSNDPHEIIRTAIRRFEQATVTIRRTRPNAELVVIMDAIDNAAVEARDRGQNAFPVDLLEALVCREPIPGLVVVATCRTERQDIALGNATCEKFPLAPFTMKEASAFVRARRPEATESQILGVFRRSVGNPRVLENLIEDNRSLTTAESSTDVADLDTLIQERINRTVSFAQARGTDEESIERFLCALSLLPPPVPTDELAASFDVPVSAIESVAADLNPLLERTRLGIIFRDEPTETLVRERYGNRTSLLTGIVAQLTKAQAVSAYAARALPGLLFAMGNVQGLTELAFDTRFPPTLQSELAKRSIRLHRLRVAVAAAARAKDADALTALLVELSSVAVVHERGEDFLVKNPDLSVVLGDSEALRRLFESNRGWYGARPSRLAIANTIENDFGEAYYYAEKSREWLRWFFDQDERATIDVRLTIDDYVAFPFYEIARRNYDSAIENLNWWTPSHCYNVSSRILQLFRVSRAIGKHATTAQELALLALEKRCPSPFGAAFLSERRGLRRPTLEKLLKKFTRRFNKKQPLGTYEYSMNEPDRIRSALLRAGLLAAQLKLKSEARALYAAASLSSYQIWLIRDRWSLPEFAPHILSIVLKSVIDRKPVQLIDCLPEEMKKLVGKHRAPRGDEEQLKFIRGLIDTARKLKGPDGKTSVSDSDHHYWTETLSNKILPILQLCRQTRDCFTSSRGRQRTAALEALLAGWRNARNDTRSDYYGDRDSIRALMDRLYAAASLEIVIGQQVFDPKIAQLFVQTLKGCVGVPSTTLSAFVEHFGLCQETAPHAGELASFIVGTIPGTEDINQRSSTYADVARSILVANSDEAAQLFRQGYSELSAIGSGDYTLTNELLYFATVISDPLEQKTAHRLAKICELNVYESHKFPWTLAAQAFAGSWGLDYLAQIARWQDRDKVDLELTLAPALICLVQNGALSPSEAIVTLGLAEPAETWTCNWGTILEPLLAKSTGEAAALSSEFLRLLKLNDPYFLTSQSIKDIREALARNKGKASKVFEQQLRELEKRRPPPEPRREKVDHYSVDPATRNAAKLRETQDIRRAGAAARGINPAQLDSIEKLVGELETIQGRLEVTTRVFGQLRGRLPYAKRKNHIDAVIEARNLDLFEKLAILRDAKSDWAQASPTRLAFFKGTGVRLATLHAREMLGKEWGFSSDVKELAKLSGDSELDLAITLADIGASKEIPAEATGWLSLGRITAKSSKPDVPGIAISRILDSDAARLAEESGDGAWTPELSSPKESFNAIAGLVWSCLGSPDSANRWRAAHAIRSAARLGLWSIIDALFALYETSDAGSFQDRRLPFFQMHARLWFLTAIARIALDHPSELLKHRALLERLALSVAEPHVAIQETARRALLACLESPDAAPMAPAFERELKKVNQTQFPEVIIDHRTPREFPHDRPKSEPQPEPRYFFDYDFSKYQLSDLGRMFGYPVWMVDDLCLSKVLEWDPKASSMHDFAGKSRPRGRRGYREGMDDSFHSYGTYLAWHAVVVVGGRLLRERAIHRDDYDEHIWQDWLADYQLTRHDGLWPYDGMDDFPIEPIQKLLVDTGKEAHPAGEPVTLSHLPGPFQADRVSSSLIVDGFWSSHDGVKVSIKSALVPSELAIRAALAVVTAPKGQMYLPVFQHYDEDDHASSLPYYLPLEPWIAHEDVDLKFDKRDPYGSARALERPKPAKAIVDQFELTRDSDWNRRWTTKNGASVFSSIAWGKMTGQGDHEQLDGGTLLRSNGKFLKRVLTTLGCDLVVLVKLDHYKDYETYRELSSDERSTHSHLIMLIDSSLRWKVVMPTKAQLKRIEELTEHDRFDLPNRFAALG